MTPEREQDIRLLALHDENTHRSREQRELLAELDALRAKRRDFRRWLRQQRPHLDGSNSSTIRLTLAMFDRIFGEPR